MSCNLGNAEDTISRQQERMPLVSIIVLTYMHFKLIYETLKTIVSQDYPKIELIISDDASVFFPCEELKNWLAENAGNNIRYYVRHNEINVGIVANSNKAVACANGKYIKLLSPGDGFANSRALLWMVSEAEKRNSSILSSYSYVCKGTFENICYKYPLQKYNRLLKNAPSEKLFEKLLTTNILSAVGTIYSKQFFDNGGFDEGYRYLDDWPMWLSHLQNGGKIDFISKVTTYYMLGGISSASGTAYESELLKDDMTKCMEDKVLPYMDRLPWHKRELLKYRYLQLSHPEDLSAQPMMMLIGFTYRIKKHVKKHLIELKSKCRRISK